MVFCVKRTYSIGIQVWNYFIELFYYFDRGLDSIYGWTHLRI